MGKAKVPSIHQWNFDLPLVRLAHVALAQGHVLVLIGQLESMRICT